MASRTVYVSDNDEALFARAAELGGGLSPAIAAALRAWVSTKEAAMEGYTEVTVKLGDGWAVREKRFLGRRLVRLSLPAGSGRVVRYDVHLTRRGQLAVYSREDLDWTQAAQEDSPLWRDPATWTSDWYRPGPRELQVFPSVEAMAGHMPEEVVEAARQALDQPPVEVLDI
jgi:EXLDI family protein